ncbi:alpha-ketoglutarate-dependent dioxygenase AlkB [Algicella marina]|uniref:Alpha-ketoglutarate-dependent dioxygenase AlkB n=1 Tax=Algicella marina TaxID=2683284 RepID=A0A6P1T7J1_9RHOB|nr:alpha-ketoglutarate-dependent dioxygenase AlkB [Algicella marina]QHQ37476.1 alpha-ketoglutarate-dependent dioxygenase AlkB [Algicella marina]
MQSLTIKGFRILKGYLSPEAQIRLRDDLRAVVAQAPLRHYTTPGGRRMSVAMSAAGRFGWMTDRQGYRYSETQPDGTPWPPIPDSIMAIWQAEAGSGREPECCLINHYAEGARMGLHQDNDEASFDHPVLSVSLGDPATFRMGGTSRADPTQSVLLESGDVVIMGGDARRAYHGIDRIRFGRSDLLLHGGRINLTLRVVT